MSATILKSVTVLQGLKHARTCLSNSGQPGKNEIPRIWTCFRAPCFSTTAINCFFTQTSSYAARRGTREKARKKQRQIKLRAAAKQLQTDSKQVFTKRVHVQVHERIKMYHETREPTDDVWMLVHNKRRMFPIVEAIEMHRELHHPSMLNLPHAPLYLMLEFDMSLEKKNRFLDTFSGVVANPYYFDDGKNRTVMALCKNEKDQNDALLAGAEIAGGLPLIKQIQQGEVIVSNYNYIVAHAEIITDLPIIRGILKKRYPSTAKGSVGLDMHALVQQFKRGIEYSVEKDDIQHNFGYLEVPVGQLSMPSEHLEANIGSLIRVVSTYRPARLGPFVTVAALRSPPTKEVLGIDISNYTPNNEIVEKDEDDEPEGMLAKKQ